jgi:hypothetical protein
VSVKYRLYEDHGFVAPCPAFAGSDHFDALRLWAAEHNDWKGPRKVAVIASDEGRFWLIRRDGSVLREVSDVRGRTGGRSQAKKLGQRLDGTRPFTPKSAGDLGYQLPAPDRYHHRTIHVHAATPVESPAGE